MERIWKPREVPQSIAWVLENADITKVCVEAQSEMDAIKQFQVFGVDNNSKNNDEATDATHPTVQPQNFIDIADYIAETQNFIPPTHVLDGFTYNTSATAPPKPGNLQKNAQMPIQPQQERLRRFGLSELVACYMGEELWKPKRIRVGDWSRTPFTTLQKQYAAMDAYASLHLYRLTHGTTGNNVSKEHAHLLDYLREPNRVMDVSPELARKLWKRRVLVEVFSELDLMMSVSMEHSGYQLVTKDVNWDKVSPSSMLTVVIEEFENDKSVE
jgi:hypothetical protein